MENFMMFLWKASACLILFYAGYLLIFRNSVHFQQQRFFLWTTIILSLLLPFNPYSLRIPDNAAIPVTSTSTIQTNVSEGIHSVTLKDVPEETAPVIKPDLPYTRYLQILYFIVMAAFLTRLLFGLFRFLYIYMHSMVHHFQGKRVFLTHKIEGSTSFFCVLFLNPGLKAHPQLSKIISHENIHASQYHTLDVLMIELLAAVMWFNPAVWMLRRSLQQLHEYLADEGVINSGIDRLEYQQLLVNHIAEEALLLTSGFQSSIKKRMIMMTKNQMQSKSVWKLWLLLPLTTGIFMINSCMNKPAADAGEIVSAVAPVKMNVFYLGADNPINVAVAGYSPAEIKAVIDNGNLIAKQEGLYIAQPQKLGMAIISLYHGEKKIGEYQFRIKKVPDPVALLNGKKGGEISKAELSNAKMMEVMMENFDFDLTFRITEFTVSATIDGFTKDEIAKSNNFTNAQLELMKRVGKGNKLYLNDIKAVGPDGSTRDLAPLIFTVTD